MIAKQISVFLENKTGRLHEVTTALGEAKINMSALSIADTSEFGILRLIVSDPDKAYQVLKEKGFSVNLTDVICISCPNEPGSLARVLHYLSGEQIAIEYLYAFSVIQDESANVIIRADDPEQCVEVLQKHQVELIAASDLYKI